MITLVVLPIDLDKIDLGVVSCAHEYIDGSEKLADVVIKVLKDNKII